jgi:carboxylate-amine ligase
MAVREPPLSIGIEEEYLLVDRASRDVVADPPRTMMKECEALLTGQVSPEFLRSQIEVETRIYGTVGEARADLANLRATVAKVAAKYGLASLAAGTHPFATWADQKHTDAERYNVLARDLQGVARRLMTCGLHVHVGIDDDDLRIDLMNQVAYFLPHLLALSASSPFWNGQDSGLMSYRLAVFDGLPRTGLPDRFDSYGEYERFVAGLVATGLIDDASKLWWDIRPSARFPTLEMRLCDMCPSLDDAIAIAALFQCLVSRLYRLRRDNQRCRIYPRALVQENRWLAQRYGTSCELVDFGKGERIAYTDLLDEIIALVAEDAARLDCAAEIARARHRRPRHQRASPARRLQWRARRRRRARRGASRGRRHADRRDHRRPRRRGEGRRIAPQLGACHARSNPHRTRSRRLSHSGRALSQAYRCPEHRPDEPVGLLPQLPVEVVPRRSRRTRHRTLVR